MNKTAATLAATEGDDVSYVNLFNPLSPIMGGGDKYPKIIANMFPGNQRAAWLISKAGAAGLLAAALFGTARGVQHLSRIAEMRDKDDPGDNIRSQLDTTFTPELGKTAAEQPFGARERRKGIGMPSSLSIENVTNTAVPIGAFLLAAAVSWKGVDKLADNRRNRLLGEAVGRKDATLMKLIRTRARIAKGNATPEEVQDALAAAEASDNNIKIASEDRHPIVRGTVTGLGLIVAALAAASGIGAYRYFKEANPNNIKFKAIEQGLKDYARNRTYGTPITTIPSDADTYFADIDEGDDGSERDIREMPETMPSHAPISVTL